MSSSSAIWMNRAQSLFRSASTTEEWEAFRKERRALTDKATLAREKRGDLGAVSREIDVLDTLYESRKAEVSAEEDAVLAVELSETGCTTEFEYMLGEAASGVRRTEYLCQAWLRSGCNLFGSRRTNSNAWSILLLIDQTRLFVVTTLP